MLARWLGLPVLVATFAGLTWLAVPSATAASDPAPTTIVLAAQPARSDTTTPVQVTLSGPEGPLAHAEVTLERRVDGVWQLVAALTTDDSGAASTSVVLAREPADNLLRATYAGSPGHAPAVAETVVELVPRSSQVVLRGPDLVVDEQTVVLTIERRTGSGIPVPGRVQVDRWRGGSWTFFKGVELDDDGRAELEVGPRVDTRWRVRAPAQPWVASSTSDVHRLDNVPPVPRVKLPRNAPRPRISLPPQRRAVGEGANPRVSRIPDPVWRSMVGRSWHRGCPVGRSGLRLVRINYWAFDGYRRRGELVVARGVADKFVHAFRELYRQRLRIRSMYRVDRFGWSDRLNGANDYRSMAADNTSAFNCRTVVNRPGVRSPHASGRSVDLNPWENPYRSPSGPVPNAWWLSHSHPQVAWRSRRHVVVRTMRHAGFAWTYGNVDAQHFDARVRGRVVTKVLKTLE